MQDGRKVLIHRHAIEVSLGRLLQPTEIVHHIDLDKTNISLGNLALIENEQEHQVAHRSIDGLIKPLLLNGIILFVGNRYVLNKSVAVTWADQHKEA
jgi:hypothetical protein